MLNFIVSHTADIVVLSLVLASFIFAIKHSKSCGDSCSSCNKACGHRLKEMYDEDKLL